MTGAPQPRPAGTLDTSLLGTAALYACGAAGAAASAEAFLLFIAWPPIAIMIVFPVFLFAFVLAAIHLLLAVPLYLLLRIAGPVRTGIAAGAGFLIGALPIPIVVQPDGVLPDHPLAAMLILGLPGLAAGFVFGRGVNPDGEEPEE